jgi:hypothetical protein
MSRRVEFWGVAQQPQAETFRPPQPVWPDIDTRGVYASSQRRLPGLLGVALAADTDWDQCQVKFASEQEWRLLAPGMILTPQSGRPVDGIEVQPAVLTPATRLYDGSAVRSLNQPTPKPQTAWAFNPPGSEAFLRQFVNISTTARPIWKWDGASWIAQASVAPGAPAPVVKGNGAAGPIASTDRASDYSPDGIFSFADYLEYTVMPLAFGGDQSYGPICWPDTAIVSAAPYDSHGNAGDPTNNSSITYTSRLAGSSSPTKPWAGVDPRWYGRLALECWQDECPPPAYRPTLAPERVLSLGKLLVPPNGPTDGTNPATAILTVPSLNCDEIQWTFRTGPEGKVYVALASPLPSEGITAVGTVLTSIATINASSGGALLRGENVHSYIQLVAGAPFADGITATIAAGSQLVLRRRTIG